MVNMVAIRRTFQESSENPRDRHREDNIGPQLSSFLARGVRFSIRDLWFAVCRHLFTIHRGVACLPSWCDPRILALPIPSGTQTVMSVQASWVLIGGRCFLFDRRFRFGADYHAVKTGVENGITSQLRPGLSQERCCYVLLAGFGEHFFQWLFRSCRHCLISNGGKYRVSAVILRAADEVKTGKDYQFEEECVMSSTSIHVWWQEPEK